MHNVPGRQTACSRVAVLGMEIAFSVRTNSVSTTQPTRAISSQHTGKRFSEPLRLPWRVTVMVGGCCRFIDAPGRCLSENCLCMQAQLSYSIYYHACVLKSLRKALRTARVGLPLGHFCSLR